MNPVIWTQIQTKFDQNKSTYMLKIMKGSIIYHPFTSIIKESSRFCQNGSRFKNQNPRMKNHLKHVIDNNKH
jgi:hypothetical protein